MQTNLFHLQTIIGKQLGIESNKIKPESDFGKELGANSFDVVELVIVFMFFHLKKSNTSNSFPIHFIIQLWRDRSDIKFVRQAIGHSKLDSTSSYVENLSDENRTN
jgi:hypothetical protein